jgi:hypothetical protein
MGFENPQVSMPDKEDAEAQERAHVISEMARQANEKDVLAGRAPSSQEGSYEKISKNEQSYLETREKIEALIEDLILRKNKGELDESAFRTLVKHADELRRDVLKEFDAGVDAGTRKRVENTRIDRRDQERARRFLEASDFNELSDAINRLPGIEGSKQYYDNKTLKEIIGKVRTGQVGLSYVTNAYGLRDAVERLLRESRKDAEPVSLKAETVSGEDATINDGTFSGQRDVSYEDYALARKLLTPENIEKAHRNGKPIRVKVERSSGELEDDWYVHGVNPKTNDAVVWKFGKTKDLQKVVPLEDLVRWYMAS